MRLPRTGGVEVAGAGAAATGAAATAALCCLANNDREANVAADGGLPTRPGVCVGVCCCCLDANRALPNGVDELVPVPVGVVLLAFPPPPPAACVEELGGPVGDAASARTVNEVPAALGVFCVIFSFIFLLFFNRCGYFFITSLIILAWSIFCPGSSCSVTVAVVGSIFT